MAQKKGERGERRERGEKIIKSIFHSLETYKI